VYKFIVLASARKVQATIQEDTRYNYKIKIKTGKICSSATEAQRIYNNHHNSQKHNKAQIQIGEMRDNNYGTGSNDAGGRKKPNQK